MRQASRKRQSDSSITQAMKRESERLSACHCHGNSQEWQLIKGSLKQSSAKDIFSLSLFNVDSQSAVSSGQTLWRTLLAQGMSRISLMPK